MKVYCVGLGLVILIAAIMITIRARGPAEKDWGTNDSIPPATPLALPQNAQPVLVSSRPLAGRQGTSKPVITADHTGHVVAIAYSWSLVDGQYIYSVVQWRSDNHGEGWEAPQVLEEAPAEGHIFGDGTLINDRRGRFYHLFMTGVPGAVSNVLHRSADAGKTWSRAMALPKAGDRPVLGVSPDGRPHGQQSPSVA